MEKRNPPNLEEGRKGKLTDRNKKAVPKEKKGMLPLLAAEGLGLNQGEGKKDLPQERKNARCSPGFQGRESAQSGKGNLSIYFHREKKREAEETATR